MRHAKVHCKSFRGDWNSRFGAGREYREFFRSRKFPRVTVYIFETEKGRGSPSFEKCFRFWNWENPFFYWQRTLLRSPWYITSTTICEHCKLRIGWISKLRIFLTESWLQGYRSGSLRLMRKVRWSESELCVSFYNQFTFLHCAVSMKMITILLFHVCQAWGSPLL